MFQAKTVIVLGAGASAEVGLPVGDHLLKQIASLADLRYEYGSELVSGDRYIAEALKMCLNERGDVARYNEHLRAARQIVKSSQQAISIDNIVDALEDKEVELVAKIAIVRAIHIAEGKSEQFKIDTQSGDQMFLWRFQGTWYDYLTKALCENRKKSDYVNVFENLSLVSFNYDRCIEHYLPYSLANYYGIDLAAAREATRTLRVFRPYGIAGYLPWMGQPGVVAKFGNASVDALAHSASLIRTFTQGVENPDTLSEMRTALSSAERIIFLGFAFHPQNMELLRIRNADSRPSQVFATAFGASDNDRAVITDSIAATFGYASHHRNNIVVANETCNDFFSNYWRSITAPSRRR